MTNLALARFTELRLQAHALLCEAALIEGIPGHYREQARSAANLSGLELHRVVGEATMADAENYIAELEVIARRVADPLIEAIGREAQSDFHGIDLSLFQNQLLSALQGNATYEIENAASERPDVADLRRGLQAAE